MAGVLEARSFAADGEDPGWADLDPALSSSNRPSASMMIQRSLCLKELDTFCQTQKLCVQEYFWCSKTALPREEKSMHTCYPVPQCIAKLLDSQ